MLNIRISECTDGKEKVIDISDKDVAAALAGSPAPVRVERAAPGTLIKYLDGNPVPEDAENWNIVFDPATGLMWPAKDIAVSNWAASEKACADLRIGGFDDWRWPTIRERLSIVDYTRTGPALNTDFFRVRGSDWHWTSTRYAGNPSSDAWGVNLHDGYAYIHYQGDSGRVLACRAVSQ